MIEYVTTGAPLPGRNAEMTAGRGRRTDAPPSRTHSGHCTPTAAGVWHCGQIVRPQRWQRTYDSRSGCR
jgi:hypothetical protein